jgi:predicted esterase
MTNPVATRSMLVRRIERASAVHAAGWIVALHADGGDARELVPLCRAVAPAYHRCALQAPRSRNPLLGTGHVPDDARWGTYHGYSWFRRDDAGRPEPASLADSLRQLALVVEELGTPLVLLGRAEGATLALAAARQLDRRLAAVVAIGGDATDPPTPAPPVLRAADDVTPDALRAWLTRLEVPDGRR